MPENQIRQFYLSKRERYVALFFCSDSHIACICCAERGGEEMPNANLLQLFPKGMRDALASELRNDDNRIEEIRCRIGCPVSVLANGKVRLLSTENVAASHLDYLVERATCASIHAFAEEIQNGYLFTASGYRIGLCGTVYYSGQAIAGIRELTSVSVRIPHELCGCADDVYPKLLDNGFRSTLILSPPGYGKTTLLRELIRKLSLSGNRVSVADERGEIASISGRYPGFDLGPNTDVMTGGRKALSAMMLLRAMNPQILAFDEITDKSDLKAVIQAAGCGAALLSTAHAMDRETLQKRAIYRKLIKSGVFEKAVWIHISNGRRNYIVEDFLK